MNDGKVSRTGNSRRFKATTAVRTSSDTTSTILKTNLSFLIISVHFFFPQDGNFIFQRIGGEIGAPIIVSSDTLMAVNQNNRIVQRLSRLIRSSSGMQEKHPACRSEEHTSELQSLIRTPYAIFFLTKH